MSNTKEIALISASELSKVDNNLLNTEQLNFLLSKTPKAHQFTRPAKGGGTWTYVTGVYVKKVLNLMFGWDWSFEVVEHKFDIEIGQAYVLGKLTVNVKGRSITKMQFGRVDIKFKTEPVFNDDGTPLMEKSKYPPYDMKQKRQPSKLPLDLGNDLKAATTDALKKCAAELGVASDVYAPNEFKEIQVVDAPEPMTNEEKLAYISELLEIEDLIITEDDRLYISRIIEDKEVASYDKVIKTLISKKPKENE